MKMMDGIINLLAQFKTIFMVMIAQVALSSPIVITSQFISNYVVTIIGGFAITVSGVLIIVTYMTTILALVCVIIKLIREFKTGTSTK